MKKFAIAFVLVIISTQALAVTKLAEVWNVEKITSVETIYIIENRCTIQKVPQYGSVETQRRLAIQKNNNVLPGMIIGGIIGGTATESDKGAVIGSILGGLLGSSQPSTSTKIIGYASQKVCYDINVPVEATREMNIVHWKRNNLRGHFVSENKHWVGQSVYVDVPWD
jgi:outer membrane lipoprotein SlyB